MITAILAQVPRPVWYALAVLAAIGAAHWTGRMVESNACDARVAEARASLISEISEGTNAKVESALEARRRAERDFDAGRVPDDPFLRPDE
ncbi:hypothetical protein [Amorphus sp. MBR-141]